MMIDDSVGVITGVAEAIENFENWCQLKASLRNYWDIVLRVWPLSGQQTVSLHLPHRYDAEPLLIHIAFDLLVTEHPSL